MITALSLTSLNSYGQDAACVSRVFACDKALEDSRNLVFEQGKLIVNLKDQSALQQRIIDDQNKRDDSPLRNPLTIGIGASLVTITLLLLGGHLH